MQWYKNPYLPLYLRSQGTRLFALDFVPRWLPCCIIRIISSVKYILVGKRSFRLFSFLYCDIDWCDP